MKKKLKKCRLNLFEINQIYPIKKIHWKLTKFNFNQIKKYLKKNKVCMNQVKFIRTKYIFN